MIISKTATIESRWSDKHRAYMRRSVSCMMNVAEGAVRAGKTVDNVTMFARELETSPDKLHLATGSTIANAKMNIADSNGHGLESIFRGRCYWTEYRGNDALAVKTRVGVRVVIFAGGAKADSYKKIRGNSYGMWIATEINLHHDDTIKEAMNRQLAAQRRKIYWDLNPAAPKAKIYTNYIDKYKSIGDQIGGYNHETFTIYDNINIPPERLREIEAQYEPGSIWARRALRGERCAAEGLIYPAMVNKPDAIIIDALPGSLIEVNVGVDFGGGSSGHAFSASGLTFGFQHLVALKSARYMRGDQRIEIDPEKLGDLFVEFCREVIAQYGRIDHVYCDSAEPTLIAGLRTSARKNGLGWLRIENALKTKINDRIRAAQAFMAQGRFKVMRGQCETLTDALGSAVWDDKEETEDVRLDDGTSDIDSLDAFEYTFERLIGSLIRRAA